MASLEEEIAPYVPKVHVDVRELSDRDLAEETVYWMREVGKAMSELQSGGMGKMLGMMMGRK